MREVVSLVRQFTIVVKSVGSEVNHDAYDDTNENVDEVWKFVQEQER